MDYSGVLAILCPFSSKQECFLRFAAIPFIGTNKPILFAGELDEIGNFLKEDEHRLSPEYLWPSDRNWCLCSDYDLTFTVVGEPQELISAILSSSTLEGLQVSQQTRIDSLVPMPKLPLDADESR